MASPETYSAAAKRLEKIIQSLIQRIEHSNKTAPVKRKGEQLSPNIENKRFKPECNENHKRFLNRSTVPEINKSIQLNEISARDEALNLIFLLQTSKTQPIKEISAHERLLIRKQIDIKYKKWDAWMRSVLYTVCQSNVCGKSTHCSIRERVLRRVRADMRYRSFFHDQIRETNPQKIIMRPSTALIYGGCRKAQLSKSHFYFDGLLKISNDLDAVIQYVKDNKGKKLQLSWPEHVSLRIQTPNGIQRIYNEIANTYSLPDGWITPLGLVVSCTKVNRIHSEIIILLLQCGWILCCSTFNEKLELFVAAETLHVFVHEGLSRCDCVYRESCVPFGINLEHRIKKFIDKSTDLSTTLSLRDKFGGFVWLINGQPGRICDRFFHMLGKQSNSVLLSVPLYLNNYKLHVLGYVTALLHETEKDAHLLIACDNMLQVYGIELASGLIWFLANDIKAFFRIGPRKRYLDYQVYPKHMTWVSSPGRYGENAVKLLQEFE